jgi:hypothetical protein
MIEVQWGHALWDSSWNIAKHLTLDKNGGVEGGFVTKSRASNSLIFQSKAYECLEALLFLLECRRRRWGQKPEASEVLAGKNRFWSSAHALNYDLDISAFR